MRTLLRTFKNAKGPAPTRQGEQVEEEKMTTFAKDLVTKLVNGIIGKPVDFVYRQTIMSIVANQPALENVGA